MKILKFKLSGDYAHFRKPYTTTSPLTFPIPTRPVLAGIIGAIVGKPKDNVEYQNEQSYLTLSLVNPLKKIRMGINLTKVPTATDLKNGFLDLKIQQNQVNQIRFEFIKNPKYIVYFSHENMQLYNELKNHLESHTCFYTPYFGISELIADFEYLGEFEAQKIENPSTIKINTVIPKKAVSENSINFEDSSEYFNARMPNRLNEERIVKEFTEVIFEQNAKSIQVTPKYYWQVKVGNDYEHIIFL